MCTMSTYMHVKNNCVKYTICTQMFIMYIILKMYAVFAHINHTNKNLNLKYFILLENLNFNLKIF